MEERTSNSFRFTRPASPTGDNIHREEVKSSQVHFNMSRFQPPILQGKFAYDCYELCRGWCVRLSVWSCVLKEYPNRAKNHVSKVDPYNPPTFYAAILRSEHFGISRSLLHLLDAHPSKCCVKTTVVRGDLNSVLSFTLHFQGQRGSTTCLANFTQSTKVLTK
jgi:hypothetical protein